MQGSVSNARAGVLLCKGLVSSVRGCVACKGRCRIEGSVPHASAGFILYKVLVSHVRVGITEQLGQGHGF